MSPSTASCTPTAPKEPREANRRPAEPARHAHRRHRHRRVRRHRRADRRPGVPAGRGHPRRARRLPRAGRCVRAGHARRPGHPHRGEHRQGPDDQGVHLHRGQLPTRPVLDQLPQLRPVRRQGALAPVTARLAASASLHEQDFYPQAMGAFRWQGEQMCLPQNISSLAVYYNRTLFKQYEVAEPAAGWHWNDLVATAQALTRDAGGRTVRAGEPETAGTPVAVHGLGIAPELIRMAPLIWSNGGDIVDDPNAPTRLTLDTPQAREVMQDFLELPRIGVVPSDVEVEAQDYEARFAAGKLAMFVSSRRVTTAFRAITGFEWDVAPLPQYRAPANILHSDAYCMTRTSANQDAAWRFLEYALSDPGATLMAKTGRTVPSRISVATSAAFLSPGTPPGRSQIFLDTIPALRPVPTIATWPEIEDATGKVLENAFFHGDPLDKVIRDLDAATRTVFERGAASR
ncbi:ABC transporter substrate-binding protein [Catellatospora bangladeshensis]|uniref:ABC transporter substrate-binding protein n=1 Tax=Catellatospora bangladeshensis TaxID=310355 RepID=UPI0036110A36